MCTSEQPCWVGGCLRKLIRTPRSCAPCVCESGRYGSGPGGECAGSAGNSVHAWPALAAVRSCCRVQRPADGCAGKAGACMCSQILQVRMQTGSPAQWVQGSGEGGCWAALPVDSNLDCRAWRPVRAGSGSCRCARPRGSARLAQAAAPEGASPHTRGQQLAQDRWFQGLGFTLNPLWAFLGCTRITSQTLCLALKACRGAPTSAWPAAVLCALATRQRASQPGVPRQRLPALHEGGAGGADALHAADGNQLRQRERSGQHRLRSHLPPQRLPALQEGAPEVPKPCKQAMIRAPVQLRDKLHLCWPARCTTACSARLMLINSAECARCRAVHATLHTSRCAPCRQSTPVWAWRRPTWAMRPACRRRGSPRRG